MRVEATLNRRGRRHKDGVRFIVHWECLETAMLELLPHAGSSINPGLLWCWGFGKLFFVKGVACFAFSSFGSLEQT